MAVWHKQYAKRGLVIIGNHAPEFSHEKKLENVRRAVKKLGVEYPVCLDNDFANWKAYRNRYWPTRYLVDKKGVIRSFRIGEGDHAATEAMLGRLLAES